MNDKIAILMINKAFKKSLNYFVRYMITPKDDINAGIVIKIVFLTHILW